MNQKSEELQHGTIKSLTHVLELSWCPEVAVSSLDMYLALTLKDCKNHALNDYSSNVWKDNMITRDILASKMSTSVWDCGLQTHLSTKQNLMILSGDTLRTSCVVSTNTSGLPAVKPQFTS